MKTDLATSIGVAIVGIIISFVVCNLFLGEIQEVSFTTVSSSVTTDVASPDPEVFNYKAINPTVEVYVGNCKEYNSFGQCVEQIDEEAADELENVIDSGESNKRGNG
ncbi:hypothetical protein IJG26_02645 [Candidatus Saccharibacteria bacterium]|nr:hypothetical protein [Candidatus Saccharibacteria bacterium]